MKKKVVEKIMLEQYLDVKQYNSLDQQQAAKTRILNALRKAGWPTDAAGFVTKYQEDPEAINDIEGIGPVYADIIRAAFKKMAKQLIRKSKPKEIPEKPKKKAK